MKTHYEEQPDGSILPVQPEDMGANPSAPTFGEVLRELTKVKAQRDRLRHIANKLIDYDAADYWDEQRCVEEFQKALGEMVEEVK